MICAEKRLCVSIASIKRAETANNILYRTARDIAIFFYVDLSCLVRAEPIFDKSTQILDIAYAQIFAERRETVTVLPGIQEPKSI